jgi:hypothetical protein
MPKLKPSDRRARGNRNGGRRASTRSSSNLSVGIPVDELEQTIQRYVDLYEFAPVGYLSFDRTGRIHEANLGLPFAVKPVTPRKAWSWFVR